MLASLAPQDLSAPLNRPTLEPPSPLSIGPIFPLLTLEGPLSTPLVYRPQSRQLALYKFGSCAFLVEIAVLTLDNPA